MHPQHSRSQRGGKAGGRPPPAGPRGCCPAQAPVGSCGQGDALTLARFPFSPSLEGSRPPFSTAEFPVPALLWWPEPQGPWGACAQVQGTPCPQDLRGSNDASGGRREASLGARWVCNSGGRPSTTARLPAGGLVSGPPGPQPLLPEPLRRWTRLVFGWGHPRRETRGHMAPAQKGRQWRREQPLQSPFKPPRG